MSTVLVPGLLCSPRLYEPVLPAVWAFGAATIADTRRDETLGGMAERLLAEAPERFALVGLSMGGYVALEVLRRAPERVSAVALLSTSARPDTPEQAATRREQVAEVRAGRFDALVDAAFSVMVDASNEDDEGLLAWCRAMANDVGPEVFCVQQAAITARPDSRPGLASIACPALVLHGTGDRLIAPENGEELAAGIPGAELVLLERCGHSPTVEQTEATAAALRDLLERV